ncbi:MAG: hypothetical protein HYX93_07320 [Chloroflexi bacterium]|nr:hypothetical protein [Chloroflexota bacterium]
MNHAAVGARPRSIVWELMGALSGVATVAFFIAAFVLRGDDELEPGRSSAQISAELARVSDKIEVSAYLVLVAMLMFIWFLGYIRRYLLGAEGEGGWLTPVAYGGGLVSVGVLLGFLALDFGLTAISDYAADVQIAKTLIALQWNYVWLFAPPLIAFTVAASAVIIRFRALPIWLGWLGVPVALSLLAPWMGVPLFYGWVLLLSLVLTYWALRTSNGVSG